MVDDNFHYMDVNERYKKGEYDSFCGFAHQGGAGKPAKEKADVMQGVKERTCELLLRPCSHTAYDCGLEGGDRRQQGGFVGGQCRNAQKIFITEL